MRRLVPALGICLALVLSGASAAGAQQVEGITTPPTLGALYRDGQTNRYLLGGTWLYRADPGDAGLAQSWWQSADTTGWGAVTVPNAFNAGDFSAPSMSGSVGWYRRDFVVPSGAFAPYVGLGDRRWIVRFESANYRATVWLNGRRLGGHTGASLPFEFDLGRLGSGVNRLVVRVDDRRSPSDLPPGPGGGWWNFGGLLREVYLRPVQRADISRVAIVPVLPCVHCAATITERAVIRNLSSRAQVFSLRGRYGPVALDFGTVRLAPGATWQPSAAATLPHPRLWSLDHPVLYRATLTLADSQGHQLGGYVSYSGVRSIAVTLDGRLRLNGRPLNLRGFDVHEQSLATGAALSPSQLGWMVDQVRQAGGKVIRSHYPLNPQVLEMADRDGILIWSEVPVYQVADQYLDQPGWLANAHSFLEQSILANQNHPSIMLWSVANELSTPAGRKQANYVAGAAALARKLDPTRPVGMATSGWPGVPCQTAYAPLDVIGHNDYFGWFDAGGGANDDRDQLGPFLDTLRACYPHQALMVSEFGFDGNRHGPVEERGTYEFESNTAAYHLATFASKPWLSGAIWWTLQDFAARPGWGGGNPRPDPPFVEKGLLDSSGARKPAWSVVSQVYRQTRQTGSG
jgi:beta-glucuronidase